ncbi:hypothetical protein DM01DRAFT_303867 [Hesseltinella vesiculosa]|uniref:Uncharacterized protein n=1 Tax=Hesseltinella vesiculosa TaxID=101127 RepID=A0A1X2GGP9_9FUNG|nr:hypothetical protein DM01DRAFT_303867 [Hesseltinella vesiculosa]
MTSFYEAETFNFHPTIIYNDTGLPCHSIPKSPDLLKYVDYRGPDVIDINDLDLIGNCSRISYCDKTTHTCQPKRPVGAGCEFNMQCRYGLELLPGLCRNSSCIARDIMYVGPGLNMTMGDHWKEAIVAVVVTGLFAICALVIRFQVGTIVSGVSGLIEKWQNRDAPSSEQQQLEEQSTSFLPPSNEDFWRQQHASHFWLFSLPGGQRLARLFNLKRQEDGSYVALEERPTEPPAYRDS